MADLSITAASVKLITNSVTRVGQAGEALTQGQPIYLLTGKWYRCDANDTAAKAVAAGIVLTPAATDGYFVYAITGTSVDLGATLTVGQTYCVSTTVGGIAPISDLTTNNYVTTLGTATTAAILPLNIVVSGVQKP